jgi:N-acyl amino acid synthase of PEP-CTERM/exosortase system
MLKMIIEALLGGKGRDLLAPHFSFAQLPPGNVAEADLFRQIAALRYDVYCLECGYLDPKDYPSAVELDDYDDRSAHVAAHNVDNLLVGTVRLVQADASQRFPFEEHCPVFPDFAFPPREQCGEVSRLVVRKSFRRRPGDSLQGVSKDFQEKGSVGAIAPPAAVKERRSNSPEILLGLYREMFRFSRQTGVRYWFAAMEQPLARSLSKMGFQFNPVGPETDYYGPVTPFMADLHDLETTLEAQNPLLNAWFHDQSISPWLLFRTWMKMRFGAH